MICHPRMMINHPLLVGRNKQRRPRLLHHATDLPTSPWPGLWRSHATRGNPMDNFFLPKLATSPVSLTNHPRLSMFIHSNMGITKIDRITTHKGGLQTCRSSAAKWPLFHVILLDFIASCCRGMSCEVVGGPVFWFKPNFICYRWLFEDKCDSFFCEFFGQLENLSTVVFVGDFLPYC